MAKRKAKYVTLPPCDNKECHGVGLRTKRVVQGLPELIWKCAVCEREWPRERRFG